MYDLSSKFREFYDDHVVLSSEKQQDLREKADLNLQRLKDGLVEYNNENDTSYSIVESCIQGSKAMSTIVQNEDGDYDIDIAVVFNKSDLGDKGALATRNMVAAALKKKTKLLKTDPEVKTSCIRIQYAEGYHIDFAVYRRYYNILSRKYYYEHAGADWNERELKGLTEWFSEQNDKTDKKLRRVVRLSKMFCKSRKSWKNMPSGLLQTVLCDEKLQTLYCRIDELFYYTMKEVVARLDLRTNVNSPVDNGRDLTPRKIDHTRMSNWKNRLKSKLEDLDVLFKDDCTQADALQAWYVFFNHDYWSKQAEERASSQNLPANRVYTFNDSEEYIEDIFSMDITHSCSVSCSISRDGWRPQPLGTFLSKVQRYLPHKLKIQCTMEYTSCPEPYKIYWKVKNVGPEAARRDQLRGQIYERGKTITEHTNFFGNHYIECYIIKDNMCVARQRINIPIGRV